MNIEFTSNKHLLNLVCGALSIAAVGGCSVVGINGVEEATYSVLVSEDRFEVRNYEPMVVAETTINDDFENAGNKAFRRLFAYISGNNAASSEIAMTAPVIAKSADTGPGNAIAMTAPVMQESSGSGWRYMFVLPAGFSVENAPKPLDGNVKLAEIPAKKVAVIRYSGFWSEETMQQKTAELTNYIVANDYTPTSEPRWAGYNPPWTIPFLRRNEVMIDVK